MNDNVFPSLPEYNFTWRPIYAEPISHSGERITIGIMAKGADEAFIAYRIASASKIKSAFGKQLGSRLLDAVNLCLNSAESFYGNNPLSFEWAPPLEGFAAGQEKPSLANSIDEGALIVASQASSLYLGMLADKSVKTIKTMTAENWRNEISKIVTNVRQELRGCFDKKINLCGHGVPLTIGFYSDKYAAHFGSISGAQSGRSEALMRAQSKLWQLDRLRDKDVKEELFGPSKYELVFHRPEVHDDDKAWLEEFFEEIGYEASRREIRLHTASSPGSAADHVILEAAA